MIHHGIELTISDNLLTEAVRDHLGPAALEGHERWDWQSWPQMFESTAGPWRGRVAGQAFTRYQVTVATGPGTVLVFAGTDLFAHGDAAALEALEASTGDGQINFDGLDQLGLTVLDRPLPVR